MRPAWTPWRELVGAVLAAPDVATAQLATCELMDEALPGGSVQAEDASALITEIRFAPGLRQNRFRAYILGLLVELANWSRTWRVAQATGNTSEAAVLGAASERATEEQLVRLCSELMPLVDDDDPEVRGLMYLLVGAAGQPEREMIKLLERKAESDPNDLARACAIQGVVKAISRLPEDQAATLATWVNNAAEREGELAQRRVQLELESNSRTRSEQHRLKAVIGMSTSRRTPVAPQLWPAETV